MNSDGKFKLALFPIPGCVSFPQTIVPLHVFEPRYRQMIEDCVSKNRMIGVCHTKSIERFAPAQKKTATDKEELHQLYKQNLTTFSPEDIFSAGPLEIKEMTEDGRYLISIQMLKRFRIIELIQNTPYKIGLCEEFQDHEQINFNSADISLDHQKSIIIDFIKRSIEKQGIKIDQELADIEKENSVNDFTFKIFRYFRMPEYQMQQVLNSQDPLERLAQLRQFAMSLN